MKLFPTPADVDTLLCDFNSDTFTEPIRLAPPSTPPWRPYVGRCVGCNVVAAVWAVRGKGYCVACLDRRGLP